MSKALSSSLINRASLIFDPFGLPLEKRFSRLESCQFQILYPTLACIVPNQRLIVGLPDTITVVGNSKVIFKLMKAHLHRLCCIIEESSINVPRLAAGDALQRLCLLKRLLVASSSPQARVVVITAWLIRLIRFHLRLTEILDAHQRIQTIDDTMECGYLDRPFEEDTLQRKGQGLIRIALLKSFR